MERWTIMVEQEQPGRTAVRATKDPSGVWVHAADAQRAIDVEREKVQELSEIKAQLFKEYDKAEDLEAQLATLQAQLRQVEGERDALRKALEEIAGDLRHSPKRKFMLADDDFWAPSGEHTLRQWIARATLAAQDAGKDSTSIIGKQVPPS